MATDLTVTPSADPVELNPGTSIAYSPDGATMAVAGEDGAAYVYGTATGALVATLDKQVGAPISGMAYSPDGRLLATAGRDSTIVLYKTADWSQVRVLTGHEQAATSLAFAPNGVWLISGGEDTRTLVWKVSNGKLQEVLGGATGFITSVAVSPDGSTLATGTSDNRIILRNANTLKRLDTLRGHAGKITSLDFSPNSATLVSGSADDTVKLWDVAKAQEKRALKGAAGDVTTVAFSRDGKNAAAGGEDGFIRIWNPADGTLRVKFGRSGDEIRSISYSPDGSTIAATDSDGKAVEYRAADGTVMSSKVLPRERKTGTNSPRRGPTRVAPASLTSTASTDGPVVTADVAPLATTTVEQAALETPPGGPILVVTNSGDPYSSYYAEILRAEGLNSFATIDLGALDAVALAGSDVVLLGSGALTDDQVTLLTGWVNGGGNLIAMRPDAKLAGLLGLTTVSGTLSDAYLKVDTSTSPGNGIVGETIQFHGTASKYTLSGARAVATLYSDATTATSNPAVTTRAVGTAGGDAAAFTYDLAQSIVYTRQGNPAWAGQERDGISPKRSDDLFYGDAQGDPKNDWVDLSKVEIPQGDEQQRLLANLITEVNADKKPLPRFWYLPKGLKAAVVMTGDDHGNGGTAGRFQQLEEASPAGCSVADWECYRGTSYIYEGTPLSNSEASAAVAKGHEIGLHLSTGCSDFTSSSLTTTWEDELSAWQAKYTSLPSPVTNRTHCIAWSDWSTMASASRAEGVRLDTNYYYWPPSWNQDRPGFFTGSGLPMRFTDPDGKVLDIYQAASQMTDESGQSYPYTIDTLLDNALGSKQYFGAFTINAHTDVDQITESTTTIASAKARNVPIITAKQLLDWTDARNASSFQGLAWAGDKLTFSVASSARNLTMLIPAQAHGQSISRVTRGGTDVAYTLRSVKGSSYALVSANAGDYAVTYASDTTAPTVTETTPADNATGVATTGAAITATFSEPLDPSSVTTSSVELRTSIGTVVPATVAYEAAGNLVRITPSAALASAATYTVVVKGGVAEPRVRDVAGNALAADRTWSFTTAAGPACPCSIWPSSAAPSHQTDNDPNAVELGVKFQSDVPGYITGIRFWKGPQNTGTHTGNLWTSTGTRLATATFSTESASGWQTVTFGTPVQISAGTTYIASYHTTSGYYAGDNNFFATAGVDSPPLHALQNGVSGSNGLYAYGASQFPSQSWAASNYWVDVVFATTLAADTTPPTVTAVTPAADATDVALTSPVTATFSEALEPSTVTTGTVQLAGPGGAAVAAQVTYDDATRQVVLQPSAGLAGSTTYTATVKGGSGTVVTDVAGNALAADRVWSFTTAPADTTPPTVTAVTPAADATNVSTAVRPTATFSEPMDASTVTSSTVQLAGPGGLAVAAQATYNAASQQVVLQPSTALDGTTAYTVTIKGGSGTVVKDASGNALAADRIWSFTTGAASVEPTKYSIWPASATPTTITDPDSAAVELGVKFQADSDGFITGVRFYKGPQNTGTHTGNLWSSTGTRLATVLFSGESSSGWQEALFDQPVAITAGTTYVASYHTTSGRYSVDDNYFGSSVDNGPLHAPSSTAAGGNGVYQYGSTSQFPNQSWQASNYWVDVVYVQDTSADTTAPTVTATSPAQGATDVPTDANVTATFSEAMDAATITSSRVTLSGPSGPVTATVAYAAATRQVTLTPSSPLASSSDYTATVKGGSAGVKDVAGNALAADRIWTFTTAGPGACTNPANAIVAENCKAGSPSSEWEVSGAGDPSIQGFSTDISVNQGGTVRFKIDTTAPSYRIDIYRLGYYGGAGARKVATIASSATTPKNQPNCMTDQTTGLIDCGNWSESASWSVPAGATSGLYLARPVRTDNGGASHIPFIVRSDSSTSDIVFQTSDTTWQAYNDYGGNSLYVGSPAGRAYKVSYNRPFTTRAVDGGQDWIFNSEYPMIRFLERNGYDTSYISGVDTDRAGALIRQHKTFLSVGHDEYWSGTQRANVEAARDAGVNLAFFSGNEIFWKTRWEQDSSGAARRTLVCYKDTESTSKLDPTSAWTGTWRDPRYGHTPEPENALTGTLFMVNDGATTTIDVPAADGKMRFWRGTAAASGAISLPDETLGYEWDAVEATVGGTPVDISGSQPAGLVRMSTTTRTNGQVLQDYGTTFGSGTVTHALTLYRGSGGGLVFGAGTVQWAWGLDSSHDRGSNAASTDMQQATVNLLADMDAQPATRMAGLSAATKSTDGAAPTATITSPANGGTVAASTNVTISGAATDAGGGQVGAVEVSTDGTTWRPAAGRGSWTYTWRTPASGIVTIRVRAVDDSANIQGTPTSISVTVGSGVPAAPTGLTATASASAITLDWADTSGATGYNVYRAAASGGPWTKLTDTVTTTSAYTDSAAPVGSPSYYQVTAVNAAGESARSSTVSATRPPAAPTGLTATATASGVSLDWADTTGATGYFVYQATASSGPWTKVNSTASTTSAWDDTTAPGGTVYYQVTAAYSGGESARSATASATGVVANRLANPSFETVSSGSRPASWTSTSNFTRRTASARSGTYGGRHQANNASYTVSQTLTGLTAGTAYTFAGWVNVPTTSDSFTFTLRIRWFTTSGTTALRSDDVATYTAPTSGWVKATGTYNAPTGATRAVVDMVSSSLAGPVHVDDFSLR